LSDAAALVRRISKRAFSRPADVTGQPAYFEDEALAPEEKWPPETEIARLENYERGFRLFQGKHHLLFEPFRDITKFGPYVVVNVCGTATQTLTDFLVLEPPVVSLADQSSTEPEQGEGAPFDPILRATKWPTFLQMAVNSGSYNGDLLMKIVWSKQHACPKLVNIPPSYYFPVFDDEDDSRLESASLAWIVARWGEGAEYALLREEVHVPGEWHTAWYRMKTDFSYTGGLIERWMRELIQVDAPQPTGLDVIPLVHVANNPIQELSPWGQHDYARVEELQATLNGIASGNRHIIRKWCNPRLAIDESYFDEDNNCNIVNKDAFKLVQDEPPPHYVSIPLENYLHADNEAQESIKRMLMVMGISPPTVGIADNAPLPQSGRALLVGEGLTRRTGSRKRVPLDQGLREALAIATDFWVVRGGEDAFGPLKPKDIELTWSEGFPKSDRDRNDEVVLLKGVDFLADEDLLKLRFPRYKDHEIQALVKRKRAQDAALAKLTMETKAVQNNDNPAADRAESSTTARTARRKIESGG
jgi:hypothetical protein